ncbi:hypothetical protein [Crossiella sp. CA198]|uniref:hypothetical protein n=1 Tax=Crossiella sp. CA198 TaxID=3455607 RepID=UPI003F8D09DE
MRPTTLSRLLALTLLLSLGLVGAAAAQPTATSAGDPRATARPGNATTCAAAGLAGAPVTERLAVGKTGTHLTVTEVPYELRITGIVVKGGPAHNVYLPTALGLLPWPGLHSPLVGKENIPAVSHWFVCALTAPAKNAAAGTSTSPTAASTAKATSTTRSAGTQPGSTAPTSSTAPVPAAATGGLANTGFDGGWLIGLGAALVVAGGLVLGLTRLRGRRGR